MTSQGLRGHSLPDIRDRIFDRYISSSFIHRSTSESAGRQNRRPNATPAAWKIFGRCDGFEMCCAHFSFWLDTISRWRQKTRYPAAPVGARRAALGFNEIARYTLKSLIHCEDGFFRHGYVLLFRS